MALTQMIGIADLARLVGVSEQTVYVWNSKGTGPDYVKVGKHVRYRVEDVEAWLDSRKVEGAQVA